MYAYEVLWTLLTLTSSVAFFVAAIGSAVHAKAGFGGYTLAVVLGLVLGSCNFWAMEKVAATIVDRLKAYSGSFREWCLGALYLAALLWAFLAAFLGGWLTSSVVRIAA